MRSRSLRRPARGRGLMGALARELWRPLPLVPVAAVVAVALSARAMAKLRAPPADDVDGAARSRR
ncbi:hypothetical protein [Nonomuraea jabiensis]|uniref:hypothetical protein n=1 Tax=Nonomuraea jabiensis TaxID=882448 RepID=UPI003D728BF1